MCCAGAEFGSSVELSHQIRFTTALALLATPSLALGYPSGDFGLGYSGQGSGSGSGSDCSSSSAESSSNNNESDSSRLGWISGYENPSFNPNSNLSGDGNSKGYNESNQRQGRL
ncbi:hypothetical protein MY4824_006477 [Beauveria thailandica]